MTSLAATRGYGAVIRKDLVKQLRSPQALIFLGLALLGLSGVVLLAWPEDTVVGVRAALSRDLFRTVLTSEILMLTLLAPAFSAGAISGERERDCLDMLLVTPISPFRILVEKLVSSCVYLLAVVTACAPIVAVTLYLGGVSPRELLLSHAVLMIAGVCFSTVGLAASTLLNRTFSALAAAYLLVIPLGLILVLRYQSNMDLAISEGRELPASFLLSVLRYGTIISIIALGTSVTKLKRPPPPPPLPLQDEDPSEQRLLSLDRRRFPDMMLIPRRLGEFLDDRINPVMQKEVRFEVFGRGSQFLRIVLGVGLVASIPFNLSLLTNSEYLYASYLSVLASVIATTMAAGTITAERERQTLDLILATPLSVRQILMGKLWGAMRTPALLTCLLLPYFLLGLLAKTLSMAELGKDILVVAATLAQATALALAASCLSRNTLTATVAAFLLAAALIPGPLLVFEILERFTDLPYTQLSWITVPSPLAAISNAHSLPHAMSRYNLSPESPPLWLVHLAFSLLTSVGSLWLAKRSLSRLRRD